MRHVLGSPLLRRAARAVAACGVLAGALATPAFADTVRCSLPVGQRIVLHSDAVDPDVFVWDSRTRLIDYAAGDWDSTHAVFVHTLLASPGTAAQVVACIAAAAHPKYAAGDKDAVGVKVLAGPYRGHYGWVISSDVVWPQRADYHAVGDR